MASSVGGSRLKWVGRLDMYRKVPADLMEGTRRGSILSLVAVCAMATLFLLETADYFQKTLNTDLTLDRNKEARVRLNFNITMMDLKCDYAVVDVVSVLGTEQNVSSHITKWQVDAEGVRQRFQGRNKAQKDIQLFDMGVKDTIEELYANGEDAISLDPETFGFALKEQEYLFVDFYASWCSHCRDLAPTWETLAEVMADVADNIVASRGAHNYTDEELAHAKKIAQPVMVAKMDCVLHGRFCMEQGIMAYPTLRLFVDGARWQGGDYYEDRTVVAMADYLQQVEDLHKEELKDGGLGKDEDRNVAVAHKAAKVRMGEESPESSEEQEWAEKVKRHRQRMRNSWVDQDHPGCQLSGHLLLDRVPGNFHIQARSPHHDLVPHMTNVSHEIHHLSIGDPFVRTMIAQKKVNVPSHVLNKLNPMDGNVYITQELHEAYHHYLKVITTNVEGLQVGARDMKAYQILQSSQLSYYRNDVIPEAKFIFDLSPIAVSYSTRSRHWYDYVTSVMAIVGGTFTMVGMIESSISATIARKKRY